MKYLDYMNEHDTENLSWCKPYFDKTGNYCIIMHDGEVSSVITPRLEAIRGWSGEQDIEEAITDVAKNVSPSYEYYFGYTDLEIALE